LSEDQGPISGAEESEGSLFDLRSELTELKDDLTGQEVEQDQNHSGDVMELKRRMDKSEQEMRAMTDAMKSTLLDVRTLMQDMDNPFQMLRDMGVDKLISKAVENVEDEVNKQRREEAKKRIAHGEEDPLNSPDKIIANPGAPSMAAPTAPMPPVAPASVQAPPATAVAAQPRAPMPQQVKTSAPAPEQPAGASPQLQVLAKDVSVLSRRVAVTEEAVPIILKRVAKTEEAVDELTDTVKTLIEDIRGKSGRTQRKPDSSFFKNLDLGGQVADYEDTSSVYYEAYISLVSDYLVLRFGEKGAEEILLEGMYKGWASPKVVRDIMNSASNRSKDKKESSIAYGLGGVVNSEIEDKILLTSLLKNLDKPVSEWREPTHLFMLLALVTRARENKHYGSSV
jgi:hypothetical protein